RHQARLEPAVAVVGAARQRLVRDPALPRGRYELALLVADWTSRRRRFGRGELRSAGIANVGLHRRSRGSDIGMSSVTDDAPFATCRKSPTLLAHGGNEKPPGQAQG